MDEIAFAIIAITFSLVAVFPPLAFQTSADGPVVHRVCRDGRGVGHHLGVRRADADADDGRAHPQAALGRSQFPPAVLRKLMPSPGSIADGLIMGWGIAGYCVLSALASFVRRVVTFPGAGEDFLPEEDHGRLFSSSSLRKGRLANTPVARSRRWRPSWRVPEVHFYFSVVALSRSGPGDASTGLTFLHLKKGVQRSVQDMVRGPGGLRRAS